MKKMFKRGITLVETIVSMAVITIISIFAISVIEAGFKQSHESIYYSEARQISSNAYEAFKFSNDFQSFNRAMNMTDTSITSYKKDPSIEKYTISYEVDELTVKIVLTYYDTKAYMDVECLDCDKVNIFSYSYEKLIDAEVTVDE